MKFDLLLQSRRQLLIAGVLSLLTSIPALSQEAVTLTRIGAYESGIFAEGGAEIVAHDPETQRIFVINAKAARVDVLDVQTPSTPTLLFSIDVAPYGAGVNSVAVNNGVVVAAVENAVKQENGKAVFFKVDGTFLSQVTVGALPDMITFTPDGNYVLTANEGEPNAEYTVDPEGSVSIIDVSGGAGNLTQSNVRTVSFASFNDATLPPGIRIFGPNATVAQDMEPEYIAISSDSKKAWVTLQENNALAIIDIAGGTVDKLVGLGFKDHSLPGNALDASDRDSKINITNWPVFGMYLPDGIASFEHQGATYLVTGNEGDSRDYNGYSEEARVADVTLDPVAFPNAETLLDKANLGRLHITTTLGNTDEDEEYEELYAFGARSFSIWSADGSLVFDSGDELEQITSAAYPESFNSTNDANGSFDGRSDDKGPEPEGVAVGEVAGHTYAFIGLERIGGVVVYRIDDPTKPVFVQYVNGRIFTGDAEAGTAGDLGPEGLAFVRAEDSPTENALLVVGNEVSGTTALFEITTGGTSSVDGSAIANGATFGEMTPNPAAGQVSMPITLAEEARTTITLVDLSGRTVATAVDMVQERGTHTVTFDVGAVPTGTYFCRIAIDGILHEMRRLVVVR